MDNNLKKIIIIKQRKSGVRTKKTNKKLLIAGVWRSEGVAYDFLRFIIY